MTKQIEIGIFNRFKYHKVQFLIFCILIERVLIIHQTIYFDWHEIFVD